MKQVKGQPITGSTAFYSKKKPMVPDAKETSADEERFIKQAPMPFKDRNSVPQIAVGTGPKGAVPGQEPKSIYAGKSGSTVGAKALPGGAAIGQRTMPNQSKQIGGRMGFPPPARRAGAQNLSKVKRNASFYGE